MKPSTWQALGWAAFAGFIGGFVGALVVTLIANLFLDDAAADAVFKAAFVGLGTWVAFVMFHVDTDDFEKEPLFVTKRQKILNRVLLSAAATLVVGTVVWGAVQPESNPSPPDTFSDVDLDEPGEGPYEPPPLDGPSTREECLREIRFINSNPSYTEEDRIMLLQAMPEECNAF